MSWKPSANVQNKCCVQNWLDYDIRQVFCRPPTNIHLDVRTLISVCEETAEYPMNCHI